uniref:Trimethyllysine dioxygenase, mitochondrial n=1 Tax=Parastrongyloides trichosuri TaxID=131310 RepID=A0A0N4ZUI2_PARTI
MTYQKNTILNELRKKSEIDNAQSIKHDILKNKLYINWKDGHKSVYDVEKIINNQLSLEKYIPQPLLWNCETFKSNSKILSYDDFNIEEFYKEFLTFGLVFIKNVPSSDSVYTKTLCEEIACIQNTLFGGFWTFSNMSTSNEQTHADTAYTSSSIGLHTDSTYFSQTPGIQVLHCLQKAKSGGENILVDGIYCAKDLQKNYYKYFKYLSENKFYHHYKEKAGKNSATGYHSINHTKIIEVEDGKIRQVRFNPYDRMDINLNENLSMFYDSYIKFNEILTDKDNILEVMLEPGTAMFMDNTRVLHGRKKFEGKRIICGAYLSRDDLMARAINVFEKNKLNFL